MPVTLAQPGGSGPFPAILMAYELWGMQEIPGGAPHMRDIAGRFAEAGYFAAIPDNYAAHGRQPKVENGKIVGSPPDNESIADLLAAIAWLKGHDAVDAARIGVIGWCGGGRQALFLAARSPDVRAAAAFYGRPVNLPHMSGPSPIDGVKDIKCPVFGAFGEQDHAIPVETARALDRALSDAGVPHEIHVYPGAGHAFMNDGRDGYQPEAASNAWMRVLAFFDRHLKGPARAAA
jgi:carboxymethylenebutenolidase